jgi:hypothetical protein
MRDFCDYIVEEEFEWLKHRRESRASNNIFDRYRTAMMDAGDGTFEGPIFRNEDFILSTSLKASDLKLLNEKQKEKSDIIIGQSRETSMGKTERKNGMSYLMYTIQTTGLDVQIR